MLHGFTASVFRLQSNPVTLAQITQSLGASLRGEGEPASLANWAPGSSAMATNTGSK